MLDAYYLAEGPLNGSSTDVARSIGMRDHMDEVEYVLKSFFELVDGAWRNKRADAEIAHYLSNKEKASKAGKASAERRLNGRSTNVEEKATDVEKVATDVQPTINHKPISNTPIPPTGASKPPPRTAVSLPAWLATIKAMGEKPIPDDDPVRTYAAEAGIPDDLMRLAWFEFRQRYSEPGAKRYKDWRSAFRKAVRSNWLRLWFRGDDGYALTTAGHQAKSAMEAAA